jgi:hypothetical protein
VTFSETFYHSELVAGAATAATVGSAPGVGTVGVGSLNPMPEERRPLHSDRSAEPADAGES